MEMGQAPNLKVMLVIINHINGYRYNCVYITILEDNVDEGWRPTFLATSWPSLRRIRVRRLGMNSICTLPISL